MSMKNMRNNIRNNVMRLWHWVQKENLRNVGIPINLEIHGKEQVLQNFKPLGYILVFFDDHGRPFGSAEGSVSFESLALCLLRMKKQAESDSNTIWT